jgi:ATP synthase F1 delta subunit
LAEELKAKSEVELAAQKERFRRDIEAAKRAAIAEIYDVAASAATSIAGQDPPARGELPRPAAAHRRGRRRTPDHPELTMPLTDAQPDALAEVYARSLFELAEAKGGRDAIEAAAGELEEVLELARGNARFGEFLPRAVLPVAQRSTSLEKIFKNAISELTLRFLQILNEKGRLSHLPAIAAAYDAHVQRKFGRVEVDVYTASPVSADELKLIRERLQAALGREPIVHPYVENGHARGHQAPDRRQAHRRVPGHAAPQVPRPARHRGQRRAPGPRRGHVRRQHVSPESWGERPVSGRSDSGLVLCPRRTSPPSRFPASGS